MYRDIISWLENGAKNNKLEVELKKKNVILYWISKQNPILKYFYMLSRHSWKDSRQTFEFWEEKEKRANAMNIPIA